MAEKKKGPRAIDAVVKHYKGVRRMLKVPEWMEDGKSLAIYYTPVSYGDLEAIGDCEGYRLNVRTLIFKAEDEDGNKHFVPGDEAHLMANASSAVMTRVVTEMFGGDAKKNSPTPENEDKVSDSE